MPHISDEYLVTALDALNIVRKNWAEVNGGDTPELRRIDAAIAALKADAAQGQVNAEDLLPCAHCGGEAKLEHFTMNRHHGQKQEYWHGECTNYDECNVTTTTFTSKDAAIAAWNRRHVAAQGQGETWVPASDGEWFWSETDKTVLDISNGGRTITIDDGENRLSKTFSDNVQMRLCHQRTSTPAAQGQGETSGEWQPVPSGLEYDLITHAIKNGEIPIEYKICQRTSAPAAQEGEVAQEIDCPTCHGNGMDYAAGYSMEDGHKVWDRCDDCDGTGKWLVVRRQRPGGGEVQPGATTTQEDASE